MSNIAALAAYFRSAVTKSYIASSAVRQLTFLSSISSGHASVLKVTSSTENLCSRDFQTLPHEWQTLASQRLDTILIGSALGKKSTAGRQNTPRLISIYLPSLHKAHVKMNVGDSKDTELSGIRQVTNSAENGDTALKENDRSHGKKVGIPEGYQLIEEGKARMIYPKGVVFYNPVQVQNRDLSVLMITLFAERRAKRIALRRKKKDLLQEARSINKETMDKTSILTKSSVHSADSKIDMEEIQTKLDEYEALTDWPQNFALHESENAGICILDALAASGLRSIRYWKEIPGVKQIVINDLDPAAVDLAKENIMFNNLSDVMIKEEVTSNNKTDDMSGIKVQLGDATHTMYMSRRPPSVFQLSPTQKLQRDQFDVIDLDPYGSAAPFIDGAVQAVVHGGMLNVTCTDMAALGGSHPETCYGRYAAMPIPGGKYLQELAVRILLCSLATSAARYGRTIKPILSVGMHFYVRVFVEVYDDKAGVNDLSRHIGTVYQSSQCPSFHTVAHGQHCNRNFKKYFPARAPLFSHCEETGGPFKTAGPLWLGHLHDMEVVNEAILRLESKTGNTCSLKTRKPLHGLLTVCSEELLDVPLYYSLPDLCHTLGCESPPMNRIKAALTNAGYRVSSYHKEPNALKTDAPNHVVWDVMRSWCKEHPPKKDSKKKCKNKDSNKVVSSIDGVDKNNSCHQDKIEKGLSAGEKILAMKSSIVVDFTIPEGFEKKKKALRFPQNPESNWGPKSRASGYKRKAEDANEN